MCPPGTEGPVLALSIVGWRSRWKKFAATWNGVEEQEGFCLWWVCQVEGEGVPGGKEGGIWLRKVVLQVYPDYGHKEQRLPQIPYSI